MAVLNMLALVKRQIEGGSTPKAIVQELSHVSGISIRSLKRFCATHQLHATARCSDELVQEL